MKKYRIYKKLKIILMSLLHLSLKNEDTTSNVSFIIEKKIKKEEWDEWYSV
jgi:hypothetical protein